MELSSRVRYALLALLELASYYEQDKFLQIEQIAAGQSMPDRYLAQLLSALRQCGIVRSQRGAKGGYSLARKPEQIALLEVLVCLEGVKKLEPELPAVAQTAANSAIEDVWQEGRRAAIAVLQGYTLQDLCEKRDEGEQSSAMFYI